MAPDWLAKAIVHVARASMVAKNATVASSQAVGRAAVDAKDWAVENPKTAAGVAVAPVAAVAAVPLLLGAAGFGAGGVAAGA